MAKPKKLTVCKKPPKNQQPVEPSPSDSFITLRINPQNYREKFDSAGGAWLSMADATQGAFHGTRSHHRSPTRPTTQRSSSALLPPTLHHLKPVATNCSPRKVTPKAHPTSATGFKHKSAIKQASSAAPAPKHQKRVTLRIKPDIRIINTDAPVHTPVPDTTARTPSIKLSFGKKAQTPAPSATPVSKKPKTPISHGNTSSSAKKRKRAQETEDSEDELPHRPAPVRKLTLTAKTLPSQTPTTAPLIKLKAKGKPPKRQVGVGYDSELDDREIDPVQLDGFILRMQSGEDCNYVMKHIADGTVGVHRSQGGADIQIKLFDVQGRRGIMTVRQQKYAIAMVDLPCIVEGMKSWDKKGWIKSIDICQMMLVLGKCKTDEEAKNYPLPLEVDMKTFQYANGLTPPMRDVKRRRFARTKRARIDDIESVERKVHQLLEADTMALDSSYQVFDHDPRLQSLSGTEEYSGSEEDAEGEDDDGEGEEDEADYFAPQRGAHGENAETTQYMDSPADHLGDDEVADLEAAFAESDDDVEGQTNGHHPSNSLHVPDEGASSFAVTSTSASPSATAIHTPASAADAGQSSDEEEDEEEDVNAIAEDTGDDEESDEDDDDAEREDDENRQRAKEQLGDLLAKIREQEELYKANTNVIIRRKIKAKIEALQGDVAVKRRMAGLSGEDEDGPED